MQKNLKKKKKPFQIITVEATEKRPSFVFVARFENCYRTDDNE